MKDGKGTYTYKNGNIYEGEYKDDHAEGKGIFYHKNGDRNEGEFKAGKKMVTVKNIMKIVS